VLLTPRERGSNAANDAPRFTDPFGPPPGGVPVLTHFASAECSVSQRPSDRPAQTESPESDPTSDVWCAANGGSGRFDSFAQGRGLASRYSPQLPRFRSLPGTGARFNGEAALDWDYRSGARKRHSLGQELVGLIPLGIVPD
jgi:hypothetical protein